MGEHTKDYIQKRQAQKNGVWKIVQAGWLKNASYAQKMIQLIANIGDRPIVEALVEERKKANRIENIAERAKVYSHNVKDMMDKVRDSADHLEMLVDDEVWPLPKYRELLFF